MSEDLIKRSDAIEAVKRVSENYTGKGKRDYHPHVDFIVDELKYCVPSADRPQGKWIDISEWYAPRQKRSICETVVDGYGSNYCPNCGAKMKGADDE